MCKLNKDRQCISYGMYHTYIVMYPFPLLNIAASAKSLLTALIYTKRYHLSFCKMSVVDMPPYTENA